MYIQGGTAGSAQATRRLAIRFNDIMVGVGVVGLGACMCHNPFPCGCFANIYAFQGGLITPVPNTREAVGFGRYKKEL